MFTLMAETMSDVPMPVLMSKETLPEVTFAYGPIRIPALRPELMMPWSASSAMFVCVVVGDATIKRVFPDPPNAPLIALLRPPHPAASTAAQARLAVIDRIFNGNTPPMAIDVNPPLLSTHWC